ncbi:hypothetical protein H6P81_019972 [Aristolochia fimbriata]|uniref:Uncharacterized protein n=1 Tax=Aristolochia fimbriata TaxID=158543 RepID=A0AAV7DT74_ARIFI|nr:hypothetical protein H6P81_019972 [Aristolochia fimbriata]
MGSMVEGHHMKKLKHHGGVEDESSLTGESEHVVVRKENSFILAENPMGQIDGTQGGDDETPLQGLTLVATLNLTFAMKKMMNDKALVRHLAACETMGSSTNICIDKTGTSTTNHMTVVKAFFYGTTQAIGNAKDAHSLCSQMLGFAVKILLQSIFNNTRGEVVINQDIKCKILGTPTESVLLEFGVTLYGDILVVPQESKLVKVKRFNSLKKRMWVVLELLEAGLITHCKGASEIVLVAYDKVLDWLSNAVPSNTTTCSKQFASKAFCTLSCVYGDLK